ncbi:Pentatricopeptide repeat-containing protein, mitochondrial [Glycine max]|nr:Pentatricopeptide repeat-containing protein, mitochondrial [Glycine max]
MVLEMLRKAKEATNSLASVKYMINAAEIDHSHSPGLASVHTKLQMKVDLIITKHGILQPTETIYVKLVKAFLEAGKTNDLAMFLLKAEREDSPFSNDNSALVHVINASISLRWLDQAHDLLDEMCLAGF